MNKVKLSLVNCLTGAGHRKARFFKLAIPKTYLKSVMKNTYYKCYMISQLNSDKHNI